RGPDAARQADPAPEGRGGADGVEFGTRVLPVERGADGFENLRNGVGECGRLGERARDDVLSRETAFGNPAAVRRATLPCHGSSWRLYRVSPAGTYLAVNGLSGWRPGRSSDPAR